MAGQERTRPRNGLSSELAMGDLEQGNWCECGRIPSNGMGFRTAFTRNRGRRATPGNGAADDSERAGNQDGSKKRQRFWATSSGAGRRTFGKPPAKIN